MDESLYIALKESINRFGVDILKESRLINILLDLGAFKDMPASKAILREMVLEGFCAKILALGTDKSNIITKLFSNKKGQFVPKCTDWREKIKAIQSQIVRNYGFREDLVAYVCTAITLSLEWTDVSLKEDTSDTDRTITNKGSLKSKASNAVSQVKAVTQDTQFLVINVQPSLAEVLVDGKLYQGKNGLIALETSIGYHTCEVNCVGYESQKVDVKVTKSKKATVSFQLRLSDTNIKVKVTPKDNDADVYINDKYVSTGDWTGILSKDEVKVVCKKNGFETYERYFILKPKNEIQEIPIPKLKPLYGVLKVDVQPYGSDIYVNGEFKGTTPSILSDIQVGEKTIRVTTNEGTEYASTINISEKNVTEIRYKIDTLFSFDYSELQIGDYFYEDGSFSHSLLQGKELSGIVFNLQTSEEEKKHGWTHGQIIAIEDSNLRFSNNNPWGIINDTLLKYAINNPKQDISLRDTGYLISNLHFIKDNIEYAPFLSASKYNGKLPKGLTSGWYLPSLHQWKIFEDNTHENWDSLWHFLNILGSTGVRAYATSSIYDKTTAWEYNIGYSKLFLDMAYSKKNIKEKWFNVRAVAAF